MNVGKHISHPTITVEADKGTTLMPALRDCVILALTEDVRVGIVFNGKEYVIDPIAVLGYVEDHCEQPPI